MKKLRRQSKVGMLPGSYYYVGKKRVDSLKISLLEYSSDHYRLEGDSSLIESTKSKESDFISWINVTGLHDAEKIGEIGESFGIHHLIIEDILNTHHRPSGEDMESIIFLSCKMLSLNRDVIESEQLSLVLGKEYLLSFQEQDGDVFDGLRQNIAEARGKLRKEGVDYLFYRLLDTVADNYFIISDHFEDKIEAIETSLINNYGESTPQEIQFLKKQIVQFSRQIRPFKDTIAMFIKEQSPLISSNTLIYLSDVHDHLVQIIELTEIQRDNLSSLLDLYVSGLSNRMNQIMKVLTVVTAIFIPLSFIVGLYGMNFKHIPELEWENGYLYVWILMILIVITMLGYFTIKKWWK